MRTDTAERVSWSEVGWKLRVDKHTIVARTKNSAQGVKSHEVSNLWLGSQTSVPKPKTLVRNMIWSDSIWTIPRPN